MILEWNAKSRRRNGKPREKWMNGVKRSTKKMQRMENFHGLGNTYCIVEKFSVKICKEGTLKVSTKRSDPMDMVLMKFNIETTCNKYRRRVKDRELWWSKLSLGCRLPTEL